MSVPQAVERVAKINEWRAAQKAEADLARANNAATVLHKEYPEAGMKWVELKAPERKLPEGYTLEKQGDGLLGTYAVKGGNDKWSADTEQEALDRFFRHRPEFNDKSLKDALKYEGDTMGHCVGGYCDEVASGASRIYSLRDAKGRPHVTIEVKPKSKPQFGEEGVDYRQLLPENFIKKYGYDPDAPDIPASIVQIKGKGNKKPNDEYLPFVQDFVKSGKWSDVGDLQNTGLERITTQLTSPQIEYLRKAGVEVPDWGTPEQNKALYEDLLTRFKADGTIKPEGFAKGGAVKAPHPCGCDKGYAAGGLVQYDPDRINSLVDQLRAEFA